MAGRNDPCPCGSGKKHKHCCLGKKPVLGPCDTHFMSEDSACSAPGVGLLECKICRKAYLHCGEHQGVVLQAIRGHVLRTHPETIPEKQFDRLLADTDSMAELREQAAHEPELWKTFFAFVTNRQSGEKLSIVEDKSKSIEEIAKHKRTQALETPGKLVHWYDGAWEFLLSYDNSMWIFSAMLYPKGRGSISNDWRQLGAWTEAAGVPQGQREIGRSIDTEPNAVHKWMWTP